jgi:hypothetical protein
MGGPLSAMGKKVLNHDLGRTGFPDGYMLYAYRPTNYDSRRSQTPAKVIVCRQDTPIVGKYRAYHRSSKLSNLLPQIRSKVARV